MPSFVPHNDVGEPLCEAKLNVRLTPFEAAAFRIYCDETAFVALTAFVAFVAEFAVSALPLMSIGQ